MVAKGVAREVAVEVEAAARELVACEVTVEATVEEEGPVLSLCPVVNQRVLCPAVGRAVAEAMAVERAEGGGRAGGEGLGGGSTGGGGDGDGVGEGGGVLGSSSQHRHSAIVSCGITR